MEDKVFLATAKTEEALTEEQLAAVAEHGWQALPHPAEESPASLLLRQVDSEEDAAGQFANLIQDERMSSLYEVVSAPYLENPLQAAAFLSRPEQTTAYLHDHLNASATQGKPDAASNSVSASGKPTKAAEEPEKKPAPQPDTFPAIPEYLWKTLDRKSQNEIATKLVDYVVDRPDAAAYGSRFEDAALFAHLQDGERSGLAKAILEQKHGMTFEQVWGERLVNNFQEERVKLMQQAVATATEMNEHLKKWRELSAHVTPFLIASTVIATVFVVATFALAFAGRISGWEMAVLVFVFALMAISPATLLLIGRPLKGLDEWSPNKQEKKAEEAAKEEPAKDKGKAEAKVEK